ncbi:MAG: HD domain-containing phosphohydrolase [Pseudomonadota bacterium]
MFIARKIITSYLLILLLIFIFYFPATAGVSADPVSPKEITVVSDDNYPPYIFRDENGHLQGILVDEWQLWEKKTGIKVDLRGMDWDKAQKTIAEGEAQVIDTIFFTEERAKKLAFTAPYASIDVPIFFQNDISGINDIKSLRGFTIGVKAGDACIDFLKKNGITTLQEFPSYESIIRSAMEHKVNVFCIDAPPALYFLNKMNIAKNYRHTEPLYTGQFHRAVPKERKDLLAIVKSGFAGISQKEHEEIRKRWLGTPIPITRYLKYTFYLMGALVLLGAILLLWNYTLRRKVAQKTIQLSKTIDAMQKSEEKYRLVVDNADEAILIAQDGLLKYVNPMTLKILGYSEDLLTSTPFMEIIHPDDRERLFEAHTRRMRGEETQPVTQFRAIARDGTFKLADSHAVIISWEGKPATLNYITDITERKKAEEAIVVAKNDWENTFDTVTDMITIHDKDFNIVRANIAAKAMLGLQLLEEMPLAKCFRFYHGTEKPPSVCASCQSLQTGKPSTVEVFEPHLNKDLEIRAMPRFGSDGRLVGLIHVVRDITERKQAEEQLKHTLESLRKAFGTTVQVMVSAVETRDPYTSGHQIRSANIARAIATELGLSQETIDGIRMAGSIHDIGKLSIPAEILSKPGKLSQLEFSLIKEHARKGYEMLKDVESPWPLAQIVYQHHERMDGSGYPRGLKEDEILMEARILAVADVVESMASHRPYRAALGINVALEEIEKNKDTLYDANVVDACLSLFREKGFQLEGT